LPRRDPLDQLGGHPEIHPAAWLPAVRREHDRQTDSMRSARSREFRIDCGNRLARRSTGYPAAYGDPVLVKPDELPVFWACGVTPQAVIAAAKPAFAITHAPGCMLVTDLMNRQLAVV
jgi:hypothetical protein